MKFGTHNLEDDNGTPTPFADIIVFTEAVPRRVRKALRPRGYKVAVCGKQRDLVIAYKKGTFKRRGPNRYKLIHGGIAKVTPHRGVFWINGVINGKKAVIMAEHRINAAFPPFVRGEMLLRQRNWRKSTSFVITKIRKFKKQGKIILAGGDLNTPGGVSGYNKELVERGHGYDRLGMHGVRVGKLEILSKEGSDHHRYRVEIKT